MKILWMLVLALAVPCCLKAQAPTLGKTKDQIREMAGQVEGIKLAQGSNCDTLSMQGGLSILMYYKNDTCYASKSTMPLAYMGMTTEKMTQDKYKKVNDNVWMNAAGTVRVAITVMKEKDRFVVETSRVSPAGN